MKKTLISLLAFSSIVSLHAEEELPLPEKNAQRIEQIEASLGKLGNLKISGYLQGQFQLAEEEGAEAFGAAGSFKGNNRFMIRRGRIKFDYTFGPAKVVIQPDFTEKGVSMKDAYINVSTNDKVIGGQIGLFDRPFGYEISYSSSLRESPERSRLFLSLFPGERDLGVMLALKGKSGFLADFTLNAGLFNGNGVAVETDSQKDFIGRLDYLKRLDDIRFGASFSYYNGGNPNATGKVSHFTADEGFKSIEVNKSSISKREYFGIGAQFLGMSILGATNIRAEYMWGTNPGTRDRNNQVAGGYASSEELFVRNFQGFYGILVQDIGQTKHSAVLKYDYYDPNTQIKGDAVGVLTGSSKGDIAYSTFGVGYLFRMNTNVRLMLYYDFVNNELTNNLSSYETRIKQNILTARVQYKF